MAESDPSALKLVKADLLKLYELSLQEYRFQITLNWDRSKQLLTINGLLLGGSVGIYRLVPSGQIPRVAGVLFLLVVVTSILGVAGVRRGHAYYRSIRAVKAEYEKRLGLPAEGLALETTSGMREANRPYETPASATRKLWRWAGKVTVHLEFLFWAIAVAGGAGVVTVVREHLP
jgi:hypothetical protein